MKPLPRFRARPFHQVHEYMARALANERQSQVTQLVDLIAYEDGHYRAIFKPDYFVLTGDAPTKSQWNTLKKHLKRIDDQVFIFKEHGDVPCGDGERCYYLDFGFFSQRDPR